MPVITKTILTFLVSIWFPYLAIDLLAGLICFGNIQYRSYTCWSDSCVQTPPPSSLSKIKEGVSLIYR